MIRRGMVVVAHGDLHMVDLILPSAVDCKVCGTIHTNYWTRPLFTHAGRRTQGCQVQVKLAELVASS